MKTERKIEVLARLDEWHKDGTLGNIQRWKRGTNILIGNIGYLTSYDAIIPLVVKWCDTHDWGWQIFARYIKAPLTPDTIVIKTILKQTPEQLSDALIRAAGEWEEKD